MPGIMQFYRDRAEEAERYANDPERSSKDVYRGALRSTNKLGGPKGLQGLIESYFVPALEDMQGRTAPIESAFMSQATEPGALFGAAQTSAEGYAKELFAPGGEVAGLMSRARGSTIQQGFSPEAAQGKEFGVLRSATGQVSNRFAQEAAGLEKTRFAGLGSFLGQREQQIMDLMQSIFTGTASAEQLKLAGKEPDEGIITKGLGWLF